MKKISSLLIILVILLTACGGNNAQKALSSLDKFQDKIDKDSTTVTFAYKVDNTESSISYNLKDNYYKQSYIDPNNEDFSFEFEVSQDEIKNIDGTLFGKDEAILTAQSYLKSVNVDEEIKLDTETKALENLTNQTDDEISKVLTKEDDYYVYIDEGKKDDQTDDLYFKVKSDGSEVIQSEDKEFNKIYAVTLT